MRLMILWVNTGGDLHNWSISYGEYLASKHAKDSDEFRLYEESSWSDNILDEILESVGSPDKINQSVYIEENDGDLYYYKRDMEKSLQDSDLSEWIQEQEKLYQDGDSNLDVIEFALGENVTYDYEREEILIVLTATMDELINAWNSGDLQLSYNPQDQEQDLAEFLLRVKTQMVLPGFEEIDFSERSGPDQNQER